MQLFSSLANAADKMTPTIANLVDLLPALQEYDPAFSISDFAGFRSELRSIKQTILQGNAELEGQNVQQQSRLPLAAGDSLAREQDDSRAETVSWSSPSTFEKMMLADLEHLVQSLIRAEPSNQRSCSSGRDCEET
jgi:hypothetical protein